MTNRRNHAREAGEPWVSTKLAGKCGLAGARCLHLALCAIMLLMIAAAAQPGAWAQGRGGDPFAAPPVQGQNLNGMHVFLWGGLKSHGEGAHDYPQFFSDWSKILTEHGAVVDGALHPPTSADLQRADVVVIYKGDAGYVTPEQKTALDAYVKKGGGFVTLHDSGCGPDPDYFSSLIGGAKKHGVVNYSSGEIRYTVVDKKDPIVKDMSDITLSDEAFFLITWAKDPAPHVLVTTVIPEPKANPNASAPNPNRPQRVDDRAAHIGEVVPQMWTWEHTVPGGQPSRSFVWMQGHTYANFSNYQIERTLLRGIAWAGKRPVDELVNYEQPATTRPPAGPAGPPNAAPGRGGQ